MTDSQLAGVNTDSVDEATVTFARSDFEARWRKAREAANNERLSAIYVVAGPNFQWLSGFAPYPGGWPDFLSGILLPIDREPVMLLSAMHAELVDRATCAVNQIFTYTDGQDPSDAIRSAFRAAGIADGLIGVEDSIWFSDVQLLQSVVPDIKLQVPKLYESLRAVKDEGELTLLRRSARCQDAAFEIARTATRAGMSLNDLENAVRAAMLEAGSAKANLLGVFKSERPRTLQPSELFDIDFGTAVCGGYTIDSSRNVFIGEPDQKLRRQWELILAAYDATLALLRPGVTGEELHRACASVIQEGGELQKWKVGHGVGLSDGHESPWLQNGRHLPLEANMVFTIDPGFFVGRDLPLHLENTVRLTDSGYECLNAFPNELIVAG